MNMWFTVVLELKRAGLSHAQQAKEINVDRTTIENWANGKVVDPPYSKGNQLLEVYRSVVGSTG